MAVRKEINVFGVKNIQICVSDDECSFFFNNERKSKIKFYFREEGGEKQLSMRFLYVRVKP